MYIHIRWTVCVAYTLNEGSGSISRHFDVLTNVMAKYQFSDYICIKIKKRGFYSADFRSYQDSECFSRGEFFFWMFRSGSVFSQRSGPDPGQIQPDPQPCLKWMMCRFDTSWMESWIRWRRCTRRSPRSGSPSSAGSGEGIAHNVFRDTGLIGAVILD